MSKLFTQNVIPQYVSNNTRDTMTDEQFADLHICPQKRRIMTHDMCTIYTQRYASRYDVYRPFFIYSHTVYTVYMQNNTLLSFENRIQIRCQAVRRLVDEDVTRYVAARPTTNGSKHVELDARLLVSRLPRDASDNTSSDSRRILVCELCPQLELTVA